jgi:hypothetical protein
MEPWQSWAVVLTSGAILYWYYTNHNDKAKNRAARVLHSIPEVTTKPNRRREDLKTSSKSSTPVPTELNSSDGGSAIDRSKKRKAQKKVKPEPPTTSVAPVIHTVDDEAENDKEWAQRLAGNKKGTNLAPPERKDARQRTVRQGAANTAAGFSTASSTTGAEADDDMSPAMSPTLVASSPSGRDVSDMLEAPAPGPAVLRLTEPVNPAPNKKPQQKQSAAPVQESKKQRQNRRKAEERKLQREEDEKERRVLLEKQLRTAREARGEPAKNGMQAAKAPTSNAWTTVGGSKKAAPQQASATTSAPLLDTFDQDSNTSGSNAPASGASATTMGTNYAELPSEEEQTRWALADSGWSTVPAGRRGRKKTANSSTGPDGAESSDAGQSHSERTEVENTAPSVIPKKPSPAVDTNTIGGPSIFDPAGHPNDSDWAVV